MDLEKLGTLIHNKREEAGTPLSKAAKRAGIGRSTLQIIEAGVNPQTGKPSRPSKDILERLAEVLHMSRYETEELLSLADYRFINQPSTASSYGSATRGPVPSAPTITEINGVGYYAQDGYLQKFDLETGRPLWNQPVQIYSAIGLAEAQRLISPEETKTRSPRRQETKPQPLPDTEPLSPEKRAERLRAAGQPVPQPVLKPGSGTTDATGKKKRRF